LPRNRKFRFTGSNLIALNSYGEWQIRRNINNSRLSRRKHLKDCFLSGVGVWKFAHSWEVGFGDWNLNEGPRPEVTSPETLIVSDNKNVSVSET
jgi:hypothetical protein